MCQAPQISRGPSGPCRPCVPWPGVTRECRPPSITRGTAIISPMKRAGLSALIIVAAIVAAPLAQNPAPAVAANPKLEALKKEAVGDVESRAQFSQQMVDQIFSYGEL